jgi:hypothetical protein
VGAGEDDLSVGGEAAVQPQVATGLEILGIQAGNEAPREFDRAGHRVPKDDGLLEKTVFEPQGTGEAGGFQIQVADDARTREPQRPVRPLGVSGRQRDELDQR